MAAVQTVPSDIVNALIEGSEKPGRYTGGEVNSIVKDTDVRGRMALCFPDVYEVAESHLGLKILYDVINGREDLAAERVYALWPDLESKARAQGVPLWSLETRRPLNCFDAVGFTLQYELSYPTILAMLDHGGIPVRAEHRNQTHPFVIGGGAGAYNPEPIAPFFDAFLLGDGEEATLEILDTIVDGRQRGAPREEILNDLARLPGIYVPSYFDFEYDGLDITAIRAQPDSPYSTSVSKHGTPRVGRCTVSDLDKAPYPTRPIVPNIKPVHERLAVEIQRGCSQACRFCQAGMITRPTRQRKPETVLDLAEKQLASTGANEVGLLSLSAGDYEPINFVLSEFFNRFENDKISISLPSMRTETMTPELAEQVARVRKSGFTFAPEAGSERMRRVINKTNSEEDLMNAVRSTVKAGWRHLKFYFMIGLPTETFADVDAIAHLGERARAEGRKIAPDVNVTVSVSTFVPKPHTSFQWEEQISIEDTYVKHKRLRDRLEKSKINFRWHSPEQSFLEGVFSRGDRRLADALEFAALDGCRLDAWGEHHDGKRWREILDTTLEKYQLTPGMFLEERSEKTFLPWDHLDAGILKKFLIRDRKASYKEATIEDCALQDYCYACGGCDLGDPYNRKKDSDGKRLVELRPKVEHVDTQRFASLRIVGPSDPAPVRPAEPTRYRFQFAKLGRAQHLSHLNVREHILRGIRLSGMDVVYSQGNTPRPKVAFSPACPTGIESEAEYFDIECFHDEDPRHWAEKLAKNLPDGIFIRDAQPVPLRSPAINDQIASITFVAHFATQENSDLLRDSVARFLAADAVLVQVLRKKKRKVLDLKPFVKDLAVVGAQLHIKLGFNSGMGTIKIREALAAIVGADRAESCRLRKIQCELLDDATPSKILVPKRFSDTDLREAIDLRFLSRREPLAKRMVAGAKTPSSSVPYAE